MYRRLEFVAFLGAATALPAQEFQPPVCLAANGEVIDVEVGHSAPFVGDFDGDGVRDLLVGQYGEGRLRIYHNTGTNGNPVFGKHEWFRAGGDIARVWTN